MTIVCSLKREELFSKSSKFNTGSLITFGWVFVVLFECPESLSYISPLPKINQSVDILGILSLMASTIFSVGFVRPLKILLSDAGDIPMEWAKVC